MFTFFNSRFLLHFKNVGSLSSVISSRNIRLSNSLLMKEITETKINNKLIIEGNIIPPPWESRLLKSTLNPDCCSICSLNLDIKHTDVAIISQFVRMDGCMLPRRITGLCRFQQKRIKTLVAMAQKAGLMSLLTPHYSKKDPKLRFGWKKFNTYFDERTIEPPKPLRVFKIQNPNT